MKTKINVNMCIEYDLDGEDAKTVIDNLLDWVQYSIDKGELTGDTAAHVDSYEYDVREA